MCQVVKNSCASDNEKKHQNKSSSALAYDKPLQQIKKKTTKRIGMFERLELSYLDILGTI
jgi:hypothetical protein